MATCAELLDSFFVQDGRANFAHSQQLALIEEFDELRQDATAAEAVASDIEVAILDIRNDLAPLEKLQADEQARQERFVEIDLELLAIEDRLNEILQILATGNPEQPSPDPELVSALLAESESLAEKRQKLLDEQAELTATPGVPADLQQQIDNLRSRLAEQDALLLAAIEVRGEISEQLLTNQAEQEAEALVEAEARRAAAAIAQEFEANGCGPAPTPTPLTNQDKPGQAVRMITNA
jgi:small-conductance mechanosensitive channel